MKILYTTILLYFVAFAATSQSVLNKEGLIKISTYQSGVYQIDASFLEEAGVSLRDVNPQTIRLFGLPGGMLPQENAIAFPEDPQEMAIWVQAGNDGSFDRGDKILFYADDVDLAEYNADLEQYIYQKNLYTDSLYFFLDVSGNSQGKRIETIDGDDIPEGNTFVHFDALYWHEVDEYNIERSGRKWFGETFEIQKTQSFDFPLTSALAPNANVELITHYLAQTYQEANLRISVNNFTLSDVLLEDIPNSIDAPYADKGIETYDTATVSTSLLSGDNLSVTLVHQPSGSGRSEGFLDLIFLKVPQQLIYSGEQLIFQNALTASESYFQYQVNGVSDEIIWNITDPIIPKTVDHSNGAFKAENTSGSLAKFIAFDPNQALIPGFEGRITSQHLKGIASKDFIIITTEAFSAEANRLANHRAATDGFSVAVVDIQKIYNEFSSGRQDISAIRNFIRYQYRKGSGKLKYVLMAGDGSFDYKNRTSPSTNFIPLYQSRNSTHPTQTYSSDDFYGFMDENEGYWSENASNFDDLDIAIGRIPCKTAQELSHVVDKIVHYDLDTRSLGKWRNQLYFVADDGDQNEYQRQSDELASFINTNFGDFNLNKIYLGAYEQSTSASSARAPQVNQELDEAIAKGALIVNYIGHGADNVWADEIILSQTMINNWDNLDRLPVFVTATCEFGRHDNPNNVSGGEQLVLREGGGAIAVVTTSRPVYSNTNFLLNRAFYNSAFATTPDGKSRIGDIYRNTKNQSISGVNNRNFILLGDPSLSLATPQYKVAVTNIASEKPDTLSSLGHVIVSGEIRNEDNAVLNGFNGKVVCELYDKPTEKQTIDNPNLPFYFSAYESVLFRGEASVVNGEFAIEFFIPKEINYQIDQGKLSFYAYPDRGLEDARGVFTDFFVGGSSENSISDSEGPQVAVFINDSSFQVNDKVGSNAQLLVYLQDEYGISITENGLNKGITYRLDDGEEVKLNDFFSYDVDSYQNGKVDYPLKDLTEGWHQLEVKARDISNNSAVESISFYVVNNSELEILELLMYPNPAKEFTNFSFTQNRNNDEQEVVYTITDSKGKKLFSSHFDLEDRISNSVTWNLTTGNGEKVGAGLYFVTVFVRSKIDGAKSKQIKKLIVIN